MIDLSDMASFRGLVEGWDIEGRGKKGVWGSGRKGGVCRSLTFLRKL
jgi:hypothetical protein